MSPALEATLDQLVEDMAAIAADMDARIDALVAGESA